MDRDALALSLDALAPLETLRNLARSAAADPLDDALDAVSDALAAWFGEVAVSLYRPAWDDFYGVIVRGSEEAKAALIGGVTPGALFADFGRYGEEIAPGVFFLDGTSELWLIAPTLHTPDRAEYDHPDAWRTDDGLVVILDDIDGEPLGVVSLDEPYTERRPTPTQVRLVEVICAYAEQALRNARRCQQLQHERATLAKVAAVSPRISSCDSRPALYGLLASAIAPELGFERAVVYAGGRTGTLTCEARCGWDDGTPGIPETLKTAAIRDALTPEREHVGCWLLPASALLRLTVPPHPRSQRNGYGPRAWSDHCLAIPWRHEINVLAGIAIVEDPVDRLLPEREQLHALRLLVDLAAAIERAIDPSDQLTV